MNTCIPESEACPHHSIPLPARATVGDVEEAFDVFFQHTACVPETLELDLSCCEYIEIATLVYLVAVMAGRRRDGKRSLLRLPDRKHVRDVLRAWEFPKALREAVGLPFTEIVREEDRKYFGENPQPSDIRYGGRLIQGVPHVGEARLMSDRFFAITTFRPVPSVDAARLVMEQSGRWDEVLVKAVLAKHLNGSENYFASRIVFESMYNAFRHSGATIVQTASRFDWEANHFTIVFWDNGESIIDTLRRPLQHQQSVRTASAEVIQAEYDVVIKDPSGHIVCKESIGSGFTPNAATPDGLLLLAATLPGVTSDTAGKQHEVHDALRRESPDLAGPGMGLYVLTNAAVDLFGGAVSFRTKRSFLNIKAPSPSKSTAKTRYRAKVRTYGEWIPEFLGNMLTVRLPLRVNRAL